MTVDLTGPDGAPIYVTGREFYSNFSVTVDGRHWSDARAYGFLAHGLWKPENKERLRRQLSTWQRVRAGDRLWVRMTNVGDGGALKGFVARGIVLADPAPLMEAKLRSADGTWKPFRDLEPLMTGYYPSHPDRLVADWVAPVEWETTLDVEDRLMFEQVPYADQSWTVLFQPDTNPRHAQALADLERLMPAGDRTLILDQAALEAAQRTGGQGFSADPLRNKRIEDASMAAVREFLEDPEQGWNVTDVSADKRGWDLDARRGRERLRVEVKGIGGPTPTVLLTPNEVRKAKEHADTWRLAVVTRADSPTRDDIRWYDAVDVVAVASPALYRAELT